MQTDNLLKCKEVVSVAVKIGKDITLYKLNQGLPLQIIIKQLCEEQNINYIPNYYALQITDTKEGNINRYVTEDNRTSFITDGSELKLIYSATEMSKMIYEKILVEDELEWTLEKLSTLSKDRTFSQEFVNNHGLSVLVTLIEMSQSPYIMTHLCLDALLSFYNFNLITNFENIPVDNLIYFVTSSCMIPDSVIEYSLHFLKKILTSKKIPISVIKYIRNKINIDEIIKYFNMKNSPRLQEKALAYLNILLLTSEINNNRIISYLETKKVREILWKNIVMNSVVTPDMGKELYVFQGMILKPITLKLNSYVEANSEEAMHLQELINTSFSNESYKRDSIVSYFEENSDKIMSDTLSSRVSVYEYEHFLEAYRFPQIQRSTSIPESENTDDNATNYNYSQSYSLDINLLTLCCMQYFSRKKIKTFTKIKLMEEKVQKKPFHAICDRLVRLLCDALQIDEKLCDGCTCYQPLIFEATKESPFFEELFCRVAVRLSCTSKEMKARTPQDYDKKLKKKFWFIYLSPNYTVLHYGDCCETETENIQCPSKMSVSNIKELLVGKKCPHVREAKNNRKMEPEFAFSLIVDQEEQSSLDFIAPCQKVYDYWTDGLSFLLGGKMKSKSMENELKFLLDMEVRLHLLDLEGIDIPHDSPAIPEDPSHFSALED